MVIKSESDITPAVIGAMSQTSDPRMREILVALVKHLHAFVREVRLTESEFREATAILNEIGQLQTDTHNEFVLISGSLGVSSLVCLLNNGDNGQTETSQSLLGPFWRLNSPRVENGGTIIRSSTREIRSSFAPASLIGTAIRFQVRRSMSGMLLLSVSMKTRTLIRQR